MVKRAAALLLVCASMAVWFGCSTSSSNRYVYAAIPSSNQIAAFREDPNAGALTQLAGSPITAGSAVTAIVVHPSKKFLYAANSGSGTISLFTIASGGGLTEVTPQTDAGTAPTQLTMDPGGNFLYVANIGSNDIFAFSIDQSSGVLTQVGARFAIGLTPLNMKLSPSGSVLYVTNAGNPGFIQAFPVNQGVIGPTPIAGSPFTTGNQPVGMAIAPGGGFLYTTDTTTASISEYAIQADGSLSQLSNSPVGESFASPVSLLVDNSGKYLFVANQASTNLAGYSIGSDGAITLLTGSPFGTSGGPSVIASDPSGKFLFVGSQGGSTIQSFSLDGSTGILTSVATYSSGATNSIAVTP